VVYHLLYALFFVVEEEQIEVVLFFVYILLRLNLVEICRNKSRTKRFKYCIIVFTNFFYLIEQDCRNLYGSIIERKVDQGVFKL